MHASGEAMLGADWRTDDTEKPPQERAALMGSERVNRNVCVSHEGQRRLKGLGVNRLDRGGTEEMGRTGRARRQAADGTLRCCNRGRAAVLARAPLTLAGERRWRSSHDARRVHLHRDLAGVAGEGRERGDGGLLPVGVPHSLFGEHGRRKACRQVRRRRRRRPVTYGGRPRAALTCGSLVSASLVSTDHRPKADTKPAPMPGSCTSGKEGREEGRAVGARAASVQRAAGGRRQRRRGDSPGPSRSQQAWVRLPCAVASVQRLQAPERAKRGKGCCSLLPRAAAALLPSAPSGLQPRAHQLGEGGDGARHGGEFLGRGRWQVRAACRLGTG